MRKLLVFVMLLSVSLTHTIVAQEADDTPLTAFDFDDGLIPDRLAASQGWVIVDDGDVIGLGAQSGEYEMASIPDGLGWTDYAVELRLNVSGGTFAVDARLLDTFCGGYSAAFITGDESLVLYSVDSHCNYVRLEQVDFTFPLEVWTTVRLEMIGPALTVRVDDETVLSVEDSASKSGFPLVTAYPDAAILIDRLAVLPLEQ